MLDVESAELHWTSEYLGAQFSEPLEIAWSPDSSRVWYAFACGHGPVGTHALASEAREPFTGHGMLPRFGGAVGVTISGSEECCRVVPLHAADAVEPRGAQPKKRAGEKRAGS